MNCKKRRKKKTLVKQYSWQSAASLYKVNLKIFVTYIREIFTTFFMKFSKILLRIFLRMNLFCECQNIELLQIIFFFQLLLLNYNEVRGQRSVFVKRNERTHKASFTYNIIINKHMLTIDQGM